MICQYWQMTCDMAHVANGLPVLTNDLAHVANHFHDNKGQNQSGELYFLKQPWSYPQTEAHKAVCKDHFALIVPGDYLFL